MSQLRPFQIRVRDETIKRIETRVRNYRWFPAPKDNRSVPNWSYGMSTRVMRDLTDYWVARYDWRKCEEKLNAFPHYTAMIDGQLIHFVHIRGEAEGRRPLLLTHGWPGSFYEFWAAAGPLAYPSQHGGSASEAFDLIIPSLPGYAFSGKPDALIGPRGTAALWDKLMTDVLGYETYLAQGGDWGAMVTSHLGLSHGVHNGKGGCRAIHLNMIGFRPTPPVPQTEEEGAWLKQTGLAMQLEGGYFAEQSTKPQTLGMALMDSPVGQLAWITEKFHGWSDLGSTDDLFSVYSREQILTNVMLYVINDAIATSVWYYKAFFEEGGPGLPEGERCETPTAFANFPGEKVFSAPPRSWVERAYNVTRWADMPKGGHFAAMEQPDLFVEDIRAWGREAG